MENFPWYLLLDWGSSKKEVKGNCLDISRLYINNGQGVKMFVLVELNGRFLHSENTCIMSAYYEGLCYIYSLKETKKIGTPASVIT